MLSGPCLSVCPVCNVRALWPNGWTDQDETWLAGRPRPWPHCVRWGPSSSSSKGAQPPNFWPISVAAAWIKMSLGMELGLGLGDFVLDGDPAPPSRRGEAPPLSKFSAHVYCGQTAGWMKLVLGMEVGLSPGAFVLDGDPAPLPKRGQSPLPTFRLISLWPNGWMHHDATWYGCRPQPRGLCVRWRTSPPSPTRGRSLPPIFGPCLL